MPAATPAVRPAVTLSLVLPVHGVAEFLPRCLDSVLGSELPGLQVVAVDDRSPDASGAILDERAARDPRLSVLHLPENLGQGGAREAGLDLATGDYVWFVDPDDWLAEGALEAVAARLSGFAADARPDVLVTGFVRAYPDGGIEADTWRGQMAGAPESFTLAERPGLLNMILAVWNKVTRRDYLEALREQGVRFGPGHYEDIAVAYPMLLGAARISFLDQDLYYYRRLRPGAITTTPSPKHLDVFAEYDAIFGYLDSRPDLPPALRNLVFDRTVRQAVTVLDTPGLVPAELRREFFRRAADHVRRHRPAGHRHPSGLRGVQYRLVEREAWGAYQRLRPLRALPGAVRSAARGTVPRARRVVRGTARRGLYEAYRRLPVDDGLAVYAAYWYRGYACNPAAIYRKAAELAPEVRGVWVVRDAAGAAALPPGVPYVIANTPAYLKAMATAKYLVNNVNFPSTMTKRPGSVHLQTQHGTPVKLMGMDMRGRPAGADEMDFDRLLDHVARWDYLVSSNPHTTAAFATAYPGDHTVLETGYPRNDRLANATPQEVREIRERLGIPEGRTTVLYAPTRREQHAGFVAGLDLEALAEALGPEVTLLVRAHYYYTADRPAGLGDGRVLDVTEHPSVEDLCLAADVLVTDYSSLMFDYAVLDRPIVLFTPDWAEYQRLRGVYFDLMEQPPGLVATTEEELAVLLAAVGEPASAAESDKLRAAFRERFCPWDDGGAAERVVRAVFPVRSEQPG
ncbi:CDP-glycerol glycerophosphotransferase family protein [Streptacidiphilus sp. N8-3]|uniref:CDP-glycerol glycerophosphotransferase family protein n=2 Tax=Streptacidiphilus cavernicola TaxID=3342716 RepID=A0ABV6VNK4_9ACTN